MRKLLLLVLSVVLVPGTAIVSAAQPEMKPLLVVSFAGYDRLMESIDALVASGGSSNFSKGIEAMLMAATQGQGLTGLDKARPWALVVLSDGASPSEKGTLAEQTQWAATHFASYIFIPATDLKQLVAIARQTPVAGLIKFEKDVCVIQAGPRTLYGQQKGDWAVIAVDKSQLSTAPADPQKFLGDLPKKYELGARLFLKNVPQQARNQVVAGLSAGAEVAMSQAPRTDQAYAAGAKAGRQQIEHVIQNINDMDEIVLGWTLDRSAKTTHLDLDLIAQSGTKLAKQFALLKPGKTDFAGFLVPEAALSANWCRTLSDSEVTESKQTLIAIRKAAIKSLENEELSDAQLELATQLLGDIFDVFDKTLDRKKDDGGMAVLFEPDGAAVIAGTSLAEGAKLETVLKRLVEDLQNSDPEAGKMFKLNAETYQGIRFHTLLLPSPSDEMKPLVGDTLEVVIGIADNKLTLAAGRDASGRLKTAIDQSIADHGKEVPPIQVIVCMSAVCRFCAAVANDEQFKEQATKLSLLLEKVAGKDHVRLTGNAIANGVRFRLEIEEGLLKALRAGASVAGGLLPGAMPMPGAMPPGGAPPTGNHQ